MRKPTLGLHLLLLLSLSTSLVMSQTLTGRVSSEGTAVIGANVRVKATSKGTTTDSKGKYTLKLDPGTYDVTFSGIGYATKTANVTLGPNEEKVLDVELQTQAVELQGVVIVGTRADTRSVHDSPLPLNVIDVSSVIATGQSSFDKALQVKVPSFTSTNTPVNDATSLLDPYEIRNMGPSRTLLLINGKRKNFSSLVYIQNSVGRGETGADLAAIPVAAIKKIEVLRDGASALYGTDAIAGVINVILKDNVDKTTVNLQTGATSKGDGNLYQIDMNTGSSLKNGGFTNFTVQFQHQVRTQRSGKIDIAAELDPDLGLSSDTALVRRFLSKYPDGKNVAGNPEVTVGNFEANVSLAVGDNDEVYGNAAYVVKRVLSFANYRQPYWKEDPNFLLHRPGEEYIGYHPTFQGDLEDYNATIGYKTKRNDWKVDISATIGGNKQLYTVEGTQNFSLGPNSPINFKPGGYGFSHIVGNIDVTRALTPTLNAAIGSEIRKEEFQMFPGDTASYAGVGANSFAGIRAENAILADRYNLGVYVDLAWDVTDQWLLNATVRGEQYSDFGDAGVWKLSTRYKFMQDKMVLRGSASTGFRAPSMNQIYNQVNQYSFGQGTIVISGLASNVSKAAAKLGVERLKPEHSLNLTAGIGFNPSSQMNFDVDYYNILLKDRVVLSSRLSGPQTGTKLDALLASSGVSDVAFFINGVDTRTQGVDFDASVKNIELAEDYYLNISLAGNYNSATKEGNVITPAPIAAAGGVIYNKTEESYLLTSRPKYKGTLSIDLAQSKWGLTLNNTLYGPATFVNNDLRAIDSRIDNPNATSSAHIVFDTKVLTDLIFNYRLSETVTLIVAADNILNVLPHYNLEDLPTGANYTFGRQLSEQQIRALIDFNGRYNLTSYDGSHFSINGTTFLVSMNVSF